MPPQTRRLIALQLLGGPLVLGSYVAGFVLWPEATAQMWGGVPTAIRPLYTGWMFVAAAGYFLFSRELTFRTDPAGAGAGTGGGFTRVLVAYALVLFPSALWLPLTAWHLAAPSALRFAAVWVVLVLVAAGTVGIIVALHTRRPARESWGAQLALLGAYGFAFQTVVLDGLAWPLFWILR